MKQNITLSLDKRLLQKARVLAVKRSTSVSRLLSDELASIVKEAEQYEKSRRRALSDLEQGFHLGGTPAFRDELHER